MRPGSCVLLLLALPCLVFCQSEVDQSDVPTLKSIGEWISDQLNLENVGAVSDPKQVNNTDSDGICHFGDYSGEARCTYAKTDEDCEGGRFVNFLQEYACAPKSRRPLILCLYFILLLVLFYFLGTTADMYFCPQVEELSDRLGLTPRVAGVTLLSLGNGAPDVFSGIAAVRENKIGLVLGQLTGGGMFVVSVVAGGVIFVAHGIRTRFPLLRDMEMYFVAAVVLCVLTSQNELRIWTAAILLLYYLTFVGLAYYSDKTTLKKVTAGSFRHLEAMPQLERSATHAELLNKEYRISKRPRMSFGTVLDHLSYTSEGNFKRTLTGYIAGDIKGFIMWCEAPFTVMRNMTVVNCVGETWSSAKDSRIKASIAVMFTPIFLTFWLDSLSSYVGACPAWVFTLVMGLPLAVTFLCTCPTDHPPRYALLMIVIGFVTAALWVDIFASELVGLLTALGNILHVSELTMGATILAWGNCIGDLTADILLARNKREGMAITACFAGPMFNLLIVMGFGILMSGKSKLDTDINTHTLISFLFLITSLVMSIIVAFSFGKLTPEGGNRLPKNYSYVLWALYLAFLISIITYEIAGDPET